MECGAEGWTLQRQACEHQGDSCDHSAFACFDGSWSFVATPNPPQPCPELQPEPSSACEESRWGYRTCGYFCGDGSGWTVGRCENDSLWGSVHPRKPVWVFDGACDGDCSPHEGKLLQEIQANKDCELDSDCQVLTTSGCSLAAEHCSGAFYVNQVADLTALEALDRAHSECLGVQCTTCRALPPAAVCNYGKCYPQGGLNGEP